MFRCRRTPTPAIPTHPMVHQRWLIRKSQPENCPFVIIFTEIESPVRAAYRFQIPLTVSPFSIKDINIK
jgi:hypothetical protein